MKHADKIETIKNGKPVRAADFIFMAVLAAGILIGCYFAFWKPAPPFPDTAVAVVYQDGKKIAEFNLYADGAGGEPEYLNGEYPIGDGLMTLVVENGVCFVRHPNCPDRRCEREKINRAGRTIVCLPQKIVIRIVGRGGGFHFYA